MVAMRQFILYALLLTIALAAEEHQFNENAVVPELELLMEDSLQSEMEEKDPATLSPKQVVKRLSHTSAKDSPGLDKQIKEAYPHVKDFYAKEDNNAPPPYDTSQARLSPSGHYSLGGGRRRIGAGFHKVYMKDDIPKAVSKKAAKKAKKTVDKIVDKKGAKKAKQVKKVIKHSNKVAKEAKKAAKKTLKKAIKEAAYSSSSPKTDEGRRRRKDNKAPSEEGPPTDESRRRRKDEESRRRRKDKGPVVSYGKKSGACFHPWQEAADKKLEAAFKKRFRPVKNQSFPGAAKCTVGGACGYDGFSGIKGINCFTKGVPSMIDPTSKTMCCNQGKIEIGPRAGGEFAMNNCCKGTEKPKDDAKLHDGFEDGSCCIPIKK
jgi:hypothetical protein